MTTAREVFGERHVQYLRVPWRPGEAVSYSALADYGGDPELVPVIPARFHPAPSCLDPAWFPPAERDMLIGLVVQIQYPVIGDNGSSLPMVIHPAEAS